MTSIFPDVSVSTERLSLRPYDEDDLPALVEMMNDESAVAWLPAPHPYTEADARAWVTSSAPRQRDSGAGIVFAVTEFLTQRLVGTVQLHRTDWDMLGAEVRYLTAHWARGEGYACEAVLAVAHWLFHDQKFERLELRTAAGNSAAQQVAQKIGCISEGVLRNAGVVRHREEDSGWSPVRTDLIVWSLLPEDLETPAGSTADGRTEAAYPEWH
ncbi:GNAT family N-acetyltransferase [Streptomyces sp. SL13]|uniref:GNAT family N-acetyltransferase n=1 Tax=Streptantibioticus silvisoli TaxID=2705255 RepID=A0AA90HEP4_9ACTN|nr:GNAT family N-acetyltransferase [Streptantibioticus silvisoli]MDI5973567.1 GNAT family N-acetyltransferase [Streptantibioticus silvisoli]